MYLTLILLFLIIFWFFIVLFTDISLTLGYVFFFILTLCISTFFFINIGIVTIGYFISSISVIFGILFSLYSDRFYVIVLTLIFLPLIPFFLIIKVTAVAEFLAIISFMFLLTSLIRDLIYEKLFKN